MLVRVVLPGQRPFQLRKDEEGLSLFDVDLADPPLDESEILQCFREGSMLKFIRREDIEQAGLSVLTIRGEEILPERLQAAHVEIHPGPGMTRKAFKQALKELESHES
jgi:hypothetical protein